MVATTRPGERCTIGPFQLDPEAEILLRDGTPVPLGRRAVAVLMALLERPGAVVTKDELMTRVWEGLAVEEGNLAAQVAALRRALAAGSGEESWIETLPRRGYRFTGPVDRARAPIAPAVPPRPAPPDLDGHPCVAVLPFRTPPPDPVPGYVADGLVEDVIAALSIVDGLCVISRESTFRLRSAELDLPGVGHALGVRYVVSGAVRQVAGQIRVTSELAEAATGRVLVSRRYDTDADTIMDAQDRLVAEIVRTLVPRVNDEELARIRGRPPQDLRAHDLLRQARALIDTLDPADSASAHALIEAAIARDPAYAAAHTLMAELHSLRLGQGWSTDRAADAAAIERYARAAIERDPRDARALARYAHSRSLLHRDYPTALALFDRAFAANPNDALAWKWSSTTQAFLGKGSLAIRQAERALRLSPLDRLIFRFYSGLCLAYFTYGEYAEAARWGRLGLSENPRDVSNMAYTIAALTAAGDPAAVDLVRQFIALDPTNRVSAIVARHPYSDPARRAHYGALLRTAGLPG